VAGLAIQSATTYVVLVVAGRALGSTKFGSLSALYVLIAGITAGLFLPLEQEIARRRGDERGRDRQDPDLMWRATRLGLYGSLAAVGLLLVAFPITSRLVGHEPQLVAALCVSIPGYACCFVTRGEFAGGRNFTRYGVQLAVEGASRFGAILILAAVGVHDVAWYGWCFAAAPWVALLVSTARWHPPVGLAHADSESGLTRAVGLLVVSCLASQLLVNAGPLVVALLARPSERGTVGVFLAALVIVRVPVILFTAVAPTFLPAMAEHSAADRREEFVALIRHVLFAAGVLVIASSAVAIGIGPFGLRLLFGFRQHLNRWVFGEMTLSVGVFLIAMILGQSLLGRGRHAAATVGWLAGLVGLAIGTARGDTAVDRASAGFLAGALLATATLAAFLAQDLRSWRSDPAITTTTGDHRTSMDQRP
jgi:O-antigen/teichoic acid export membrane protein